jgi:hypothetical protein
MFLRSDIVNAVVDVLYAINMVFTVKQFYANIS